METSAAAVISSILASELLFEVPVPFTESENDSESSEEEYTLMMIIKKRKLQKPQRIENYVEHVVPGYNTQLFQQHFRITIYAYEHLLSTIGPQLSKQDVVGRPVINIEKQILAVIWLLATPDSYRSVGERFNLAKSSLSVCFLRIIKILNGLAPRIIKWPQGEERDIIKRFHRIAGFQNVIGVVDGTYIPIKAPKEDPQSYVTRKSNFAFTLQAIADHSLHFLDVFIGYPGSVSDVRIFRNSDIYRAVRHNILRYFPEDEFILGDKAYPTLTWCIPPYINRGNLTQSQVYFNTVHARTRQTIERSFALLMGRFRRLKFLDMNRTDLIPATVLAACVLHNVCLNFNDLFIEEYIQEGIDVVRNNGDMEAEHDIPNNMIAQGRIRRDGICRELYRNRNN